MGYLQALDKAAASVTCGTCGLVAERDASLCRRGGIDAIVHALPTSPMQWRPNVPLTSRQALPERHSSAIGRRLSLAHLQLCQPRQPVHASGGQDCLLLMMSYSSLMATHACMAPVLLVDFRVCIAVSAITLELKHWQRWRFAGLGTGCTHGWPCSQPAPQTLAMDASLPSGTPGRGLTAAYA